MTDKEMQEQQTVLQEGMRIKAIELGYNPDDLEPVYDGVVDINKYLRSSPRLMWVLKEPYDDFDEDGNPYGGGWTILADLPPGASLAAVVRRNPTFRNVAWASFSIKHGGVLYENLPWIQDDPTVADSLLEVAYVNVSKMPGRSRTDPTTLLNLYESWKSVLFKQIDLYKPDVMIFCGTITLQCFAKDMGLDLSVPEQSFRHGQSVADVHHCGPRLQFALQRSPHGIDTWGRNQLTGLVGFQIRCGETQFMTDMFS